MYFWDPANSRAKRLQNSTSYLNVIHKLVKLLSFSHDLQKSAQSPRFSCWRINLPSQPPVSPCCVPNPTTSRIQTSARSSSQDVFMPRKKLCSLPSERARERQGEKTLQTRHEMKYTLSIYTYGRQFILHTLLWKGRELSKSRAKILVGGS